MSFDVRLPRQENAAWVGAVLHQAATDFHFFLNFQNFGYNDRWL
jgi:hypothetical protein